MELWQRGKNERNDGLGPRNVIQVNRPITVLASDWNYTRVEFKGRMEGKIDLQRSRFEDSVRIIHGPVKLPNEKIDSDNLPVGALVHDFRSPAFVWNAGLFAFCAAVDRDIKRRLLRCGSTSATERPNSNVKKMLPFFCHPTFRRSGFTVWLPNVF